MDEVKQRELEKLVKDDLARRDAIISRVDPHSKTPTTRKSNLKSAPSEEDKLRKQLKPKYNGQYLTLIPELCFTTKQIKDMFKTKLPKKEVSVYEVDDYVIAISPLVKNTKKERFNIFFDRWIKKDVYSFRGDLEVEPDVVTKEANIILGDAITTKKDIYLFVSSAKEKNYYQGVFECIDCDTKTKEPVEKDFYHRAKFTLKCIRYANSVL